MPTVHQAVSRLPGRPRSFLAPLAICIAWVGLLPTARAVPIAAAAGLQTRAAAARELSAARQEVLIAQAECARRRAALDEFLASHLDAQQEAAAQQQQSDAEREQQAKRHEEFDSQLAELQAKRVELLQTLTEEHPEVIEITSRIESLEARLNAAEAPELDPAGGRSAGESGPALDAAEYRRMLADWRTAERRLDSARQAESAAADRLRAVTEMLLHMPGPSAAPATAHAGKADSARPVALPEVTNQRRDDVARATPAAAERARDQQASRTQSLALASLALAVMLAALAAVRLARATSDPLFASADEVSAALAVPVVGLVPFGAKSGAIGDSGLKRGVILLAQIGLALALFGAVAYGVVHFDAVIRFFSDPVESLRSAVGV